MKLIVLLIICCLTGVTLAEAADCRSAGQRVAEEQSGELAKAEPQKKDGQPVCVVVVIVPGRNGEKPRRVEVAVPAN